MPDKYKFINGQWYEVDDQGNVIYSDQYSDIPGTLTKEVETGNMIDDPNSKRTYYTISGPSRSQGFVTRQGRKDRRNARREITGSKNEITNFEQNYNNGQHITRHQLRDNNFLEDLSEMQYNNANDANLASDVVYPQIRDIELGNLDVNRRWSTNKKVFSPHIERSICSPTKLHLFKRKPGYKIEFDWNKGHNRVYNNRVKSNTEYDQIPEMKTQYAVPVQTRVEEKTETKSALIPKKTSTTNSSTKVTTTPRRTNRPATRSTTVKPKSTQTYTPQTNTTSVDTIQTRTKSRLVFPDGSYGDWTYGEWTEQ